MLSLLSAFNTREKLKMKNSKLKLPSKLNSGFMSSKIVGQFEAWFNSWFSLSSCLIVADHNGF